MALRSMPPMCQLFHVMWAAGSSICLLYTSLGYENEISRSMQADCKGKQVWFTRLHDTDNGAFLLSLIHISI